METEDQAWHPGRAIRAGRDAHGWTQKTLGTALGVDQSAIAQWETGRTRPSGRSLERLALVLGLPAEVLLGQASDGSGKLHPDALELAYLADRMDDRTRRALLSLATTWLAAGPDS